MSPASTQSLVAVPFLSEAPGLVARTLKESCSHPAVGAVLGICGDDESANAAVAELVRGLEGITVIPQQRIGNLRPGKGDAINTGLRFLLEETGYRRLHFYDADIKTFDRGWIERAELALDQGYDQVRHFYPRAPTDGMITWMVTRPGFGLLWPRSVLPWIEQPMSGEVAFTRAAVATLAADPAIAAQSNWGIDTAITHRSVAHGLAIFETFAPEGKDHELYGSLIELKTMLLECLQTMQRLRSTSAPQPIRHTIDSGPLVAADITKKIAFDAEATRQISARAWPPEQLDLLGEHFGSIPDDLDSESWLTILRVLIDHYDPASSDWQGIAFRLWIQRVLFYSEVIRGATYDHAMQHLREMVQLSVTI